MRGMDDIVEVYFEEDDEIEKYKLVTSIRGNSMENRISIESPIGMALKGHKVGDRVEVKVNDNYSYFLEIRSIDKTGSEDEEIRGFQKTFTGFNTHSEVLPEMNNRIYSKILFIVEKKQ